MRPFIVNWNGDYLGHVPLLFGQCTLHFFQSKESFEKQKIEPLYDEASSCNSGRIQPQFIGAPNIFDGFQI